MEKLDLLGGLMHNLNEPDLLASLLFSGAIFIKYEDISWDGSRHFLSKLCIRDIKKLRDVDFTSAQSVHQGLARYSSANVIVRSLVQRLLICEKDQKLRIPISRLDPCLFQPGLLDGEDPCHSREMWDGWFRYDWILPKGDLTAISLAYLGIQGVAYSIRVTDGALYEVSFNPRLVQAIPCLFDLICRLIWDFRTQCGDANVGPFDVLFLGKRAYESERLLWFVGELADGPIEGRQKNPVVVHVESEPEVVFPWI